MLLVLTRSTIQTARILIAIRCQHVECAQSAAFAVASRHGLRVAIERDNDPLELVLYGVEFWREPCGLDLSGTCVFCPWSTVPAVESSWGAIKDCYR